MKKTRLPELTDFSAESVAKRVGICVAYYKRIAAGKVVPSYRVAKQIASVTGTSMKSILLRQRVEVQK